jgi:hypothetical protein
MDGTAAFGGEGSMPAHFFPLGAPVVRHDVPATRLRLTLIDRVDAWSFTSQRVLPRTRKARALLAILVLAAPQPVARAHRLAPLEPPRRGAGAARSARRCTSCRRRCCRWACR